jgi:hypothetical protein
MSFLSSRVLKFFAFLLFTVGFIAPLILVGVADQRGEVSFSQLGSMEKYQNFSPLIVEELSENEEEKDLHRVIDSCIAFAFLVPHHLAFDIHQSDGVSYVSSIQQSKAYPALFQVHRELII